MKILYLSEGLDLPETHLLLGIRASGAEVRVLLPPEAPQTETLRAAGIRVDHLAFRSRLDLRAIRAIRRILRDEPVDIAHALRNNRPLQNLLMASWGLPVHKVAYRGTMGNLSRLDPGSRMTYLSRRLDRIVCVSNGVLSYLSEMGVPLDHLVTIHKGHDVAWYDALPTADLERQFGIPSSELVIGCSANMRPLKGVHVLLEGLRHLHPSPRLHFLLVGRVEDERIHDLASANRTPHQIHLPGYRKDAASLMKACDIFVMPSLRREGLPRAVIEAMACGVPPVVTNIGGMIELVEHRVSGRIVKAGSARELARSIQKLVDDPALRQQLGQQARRRIEEKFNIRRTVDQHLRMYGELLAPPAG